MTNYSRFFESDAPRSDQQVTTQSLNELQVRVRDDYDITQAQFDLLWARAWDDGRSGLGEVLNRFDDLYELASKFAALEG